MTHLADLLPALREWNDGAGISPEDWIFIEGRADHALGFCSMFWPEFVEFEGYVLRAPLDVARLRGWESAGHPKEALETAMNAFFFDDMFPDDQTEESLKSAQSERLATIMSDMLSAKLKRDFPERSFSTFVLEGDDSGVSFHQALCPLSTQSGH
jgi:hypothetical protein